MFKMKKLLSMALAMTMLASMSTSVFAAEVETTPIVPIAENSAEIAPYINKTITVSLSNSWKTVVSDNNVFDADLYVTNHQDNKGSISVRIVDNQGKVINDSMPIGVGQDELFIIASSSGKYSVQAKASSSGSYKISVKD